MKHIYEYSMTEFRSGIVGQERDRAGRQAAWVWYLILPLSKWVAVSESLNLSRPQASSLKHWKLNKMFFQVFVAVTFCDSNCPLRIVLFHD